MFARGRSKVLDQMAELEDKLKVSEARVAALETMGDTVVESYQAEQRVSAGLRQVLAERDTRVAALQSSVKCLELLNETDVERMKPVHARVAELKADLEAMTQIAHDRERRWVAQGNDGVRDRREVERLRAAEYEHGNELRAAERRCKEGDTARIKLRTAERRVAALEARVSALQSARDGLTDYATARDKAENDE